MDDTIRLFVAGTPAPQGSKTINAHGGMWEKSKRVRPWRDAIVATVMKMGLHTKQIAVPMFAEIEFVFPRPKTHFYTGARSNILRDNAPDYKAGTPDVDKLLRSTFDGLTESGLIKDDSLIVRVESCKVFGRNAGAFIHLRSADA